jgi:hypothetical protein
MGSSFHCNVPSAAGLLASRFGHWLLVIRDALIRYALAIVRARVFAQPAAA